MTAIPIPAIVSQSWPARRLLPALWFGALAMLLTGLGAPVVQRTQEARVLETAREMYDKGFEAWMIPRLNGEIRMQKPPLAYWAAAASFKMLGVSEFAGRLPFALAGWLTIALVYQLGVRLINPRAGLFAALALTSSYMFFRYTRLAETDILATLFVTAAVYFLVCASLAQDRKWIGYFHLAGAAIGLTVLAKGPPAAFVLIFFGAWVCVERNLDLLKRYLISGSLLTSIIIGGFWFAYIRSRPEWGVIAHELNVIADGTTHNSPFYFYFWQMLMATAPWCGLSLVGMFWMFERAVGLYVQPDRYLRIILIYGAAIFIPLCIVKNRQLHYLMPMMPPAMLAAGYALDRALYSALRSERRTIAGIFIGMLAAGLAGVAAVFIGARHGRGYIERIDFVFAAIVLAGTIAAIAVWRRQGVFSSIIVYAVATALALTVFIGRWLETTRGVDHRDAAAQIRRVFGDGPYCFYGKNSSDPLAFALRCDVAEAEKPEELALQLRRDPRMVIVGQTKNKVKPPPVPDEFGEVLRIAVGTEGMMFHVYARNAANP